MLIKRTVILALILLLILPITAGMFSSCATTEDAVDTKTDDIVFYGDADLNGIIDTQDATVLLRFVAKLIEFSEGKELTLTKEGFTISDAN